MLRTERLLPVAGYLILTGTLAMAIWEFNQLWLLQSAAPVAIYGPFMALLFLADVAGGLLAGRVSLERPAVLGVVVVLLGAASLLLVAGVHIAMVTIGLMTILLLLAVVGIYVNRLLQDRVSSDIRAGVGSGIGAFTWILFTPIALGFGALTQTRGVQASGWLFVGVAVTAALLLVKIVHDRRRATASIPHRAVERIGDIGARAQQNARDRTGTRSAAALPTATASRPERLRPTCATHAVADRRPCCPLAPPG